MDLELLEATLQEYFQSEEGQEHLSDIEWHHSYGEPEITIDEFQFDEVTGICSFKVLSTGVDLGSYDYGDMGHHGQPITSRGPGEVEYLFQYKIDPKNPKVIDVDALTCNQHTITQTVGDLR